MSRYERVIAYFVGSDPRRSLDEYFRARILVVLSISAGLMLSPFFVARGLLQGWGHPYPLILIGILTCLFCAPFVLKENR